MRLRNFLIAVAVLALAVPSFASAQNSEYKVTGGGQVIVDEEGLTGPGDTVAFVAYQTGEAESGVAPADGQFQAVRTTEAGRTMEIFHGRVDCIVPTSDRAARFGGSMRDPRTGDTSRFVVDVTDADADDGAEEDDDVLFRLTSERCQDNGTQVFDDTMLSRGNLTIHTGDD